MENNFKYRIQINELNNGDFQYIPQVFITSLKGCENIQSLPCWANLTDSLMTWHIAINGIFECQCKREQDAINIIDKHKAQIIEELAFKVKKVTFKEL